ncbi:MAG: hypothetical protein CVT92_07830 [Bacteroidetes bacterium HGW-Bacteroidetes-1]|jgi:PAS domain S-box-containing protein|nr:MAG: hypothetical protein CVT92_07830 [Bacteroidetes bacterium HGW-Bacteroidetes-1]
MQDYIKILMAEDLPSDVALADWEIARFIKHYTKKVVDNEKDFRQLLDEFDPDIVISDFQMPGFTGMMALNISIAKNPLIPVIILTGSMDEDTAVQCMKAGATDYVIKEHIKRLGPAILNALEQKEVKIEEIKAKKALKESEEKFKRLTENAQDLIYRFEILPFPHYSYMSTAVCRFTTYTPEDFYADPQLPKKIIYQEDVHLLDKLIGDEEEMRKPIIIRWIQKDGSILYAEHRNIPVYDSNGQLIAFEGIARDITENKRAEDELISAKLKAEQSDKLKTSFLQNMSHEIRTPLNGIMGFSEILKDFEDLTNEEKTTAIDIILNSSERLLGIVDNVLEMSRIDSSSLKVNRSTFSLSDSFKYFHTLYHIKAESKGLRFITNMPKDLGFVNLNVDKDKLFQIITNFINNAIKFTHHGEIELSARKSNKGLFIHVKDTGIGIEEKYLENIFERFWQAEAFSREFYGGNGLGLSISKGLAELLGLDISVQSKVDSGSVFSIFIPAKDNITIWGETGSNYEVNESNNININHLKILIAEDVESNFQYLEHILLKEKIKFVWVKNGEEAVNQVKSERFDVVLMDLKMPVMSGFEATKIIKTLYPDLTVIAQTAYAQPEDEKLIRECGCDDYIKKPIRKSDLLALLSKYAQL